MKDPMHMDTLPIKPRVMRRLRSSRLLEVVWTFYLLLALVLIAYFSIPLFVFYDAAMEELHYTDFSGESTKRILFVGWTTSLIELSHNWIALKQMEEICRVYDPTRPRSHGYHEGHEGGVHVHVFYQRGDEESMHEIQAVLVQQGCSSSFTKEGKLHVVRPSPRDDDDDASIIGVRTRSYEREMLLQDNIRYDATINIDFDDVISLPSLSSLQHAISRAIRNPSAVVCANERRTWHILLKQQRRRVHGFPPFLHGRQQDDNVPVPVASIIDTGHDWSSPSGQDTDFCSDGFSLYGWTAWSSPQCSFDRDTNIPSSTLDGDGKPKSHLRRQKDHGAHMVFQDCLKAKDYDTWIGVQPDLVIWRRSRFPWLMVVGLVMGLVMSFFSQRLDELQLLFSGAALPIAGNAPKQGRRVRPIPV